MITFFLFCGKIPREEGKYDKNYMCREVKRKLFKRWCK